MWNVREASAQRRTPLTLTRIYTGSDGQTHAEKVDIKLTPVAGRLGWEDSEISKVASSNFVRRPAGFVLDWHTAEARRYVVTLSGRAEVELANGQKIPLEPGGVLQAEDLTGKGHITRVIGNADWVALFVQFDR